MVKFFWNSLVLWKTYGEDLLEFPQVGEDEYRRHMVKIFWNSLVLWKTYGMVKIF
jgi:hypothetical protein